MEDHDAITPLGIVPLAGRGELPFALVHGESLVACASWALGEAEVDLVDFNVGWEQVRDSGRPLVLHDPLCPLTPASFIASAIELSATREEVVVGVRPVPGRHEGQEIASPIVLPPEVVAGLTDAPDLSDFPEFVTGLLAAGGPAIRWLDAPPSAGRVSSEAEIRDLEALTGATG